MEDIIQKAGLLQEQALELTDREPAEAMMALQLAFMIVAKASNPTGDVDHLCELVTKRIKEHWDHLVILEHEPTNENEKLN